MSSEEKAVQKIQPLALAVSDLERMARAIAQSGLFGLKTPEQALALMLVAQAEGRHPALAARDYDIIQGRPAKKAEAMLRDFIEAGGKIEWHKLDDQCADATFSHPSGGTARITWDMDRAKIAGLSGKEMFRKYPRQMLRSRVVSEGVRTVCPAATSGFYVPEEVATFEYPMDVKLNGSERPVVLNADLEAAEADDPGEHLLDQEAMKKTIESPEFLKGRCKVLLTKLNEESYGGLASLDTLASHFFGSKSFRFAQIERLHTESQLARLKEAIKAIEAKLTEGQGLSAEVQNG